jgi:sulfite reductase alpha subunit-like flavoprotein
MSCKGVLILYGSETGTTEDLAFWCRQLIWKNYNGLININIEVRSISDFPIDSIVDEARLVLFMVSTTGDGDVPSSMKPLWRVLLKKSLPADCLKLVSYSVFGLGDSSYEKYNAAARKLNARLKQLGAKEIIGIGLGDDQDRYGYFTGLEKWLSALREWLATLSYKTDFSASSPLVQESTAYSVTFSASPLQPCELIEMQLRDAYISTVVVTKNTRLTDINWNQDVRSITFEREDTLMKSSSQQPILNGSSTTEAVESVETNSLPNWYRAGDVAEVFYCNPPELVSRAIRALLPDYVSSAHSTTVQIQRIAPGCIRPSRIVNVTCTLYELFGRYLDIGAIPKRSFFEGLAAHTTNEEDAQKLLELSSGAGTDLYYDYCIREKRNYVEVLEEFNTARPTLAALVDMVPCIQPRPYSIASSCHSSLSLRKVSDIFMVVSSCSLFLILLLLNKLQVLKYMHCV